MAHGYVGVYDSQGVYQLYADSIRAVGAGDLYLEFERLKAKLQAEGLFDHRPQATYSHLSTANWDRHLARSRCFSGHAECPAPPLPTDGNYPQPHTGTRLRSPAAYCGRHRTPQHDYTQVDVILVCRGGGSIEDLWAFNDERVARAIAASRVPIITGIGHETDFTISDFVSDLRAPTPSAAAELATPDSAELRLSHPRSRAILSTV